MSKKLIIIGASGHGKVIADIALKNGYEIFGFLDDNESAEGVLGFSMLGRIEKILEYQENCKFVIAIGSNEIRKRISEKYHVDWAILIHPTAVIGMDVKIEDGSVVMANAVINSSARIGKHCIVNTGAVVEHDNVLADYVHVSPNATLAGTVIVGERTHIGVGACVKNNIEITEEVTVGAGAVVVKNIREKGVYAGVPARRMK